MKDTTAGRQHPLLATVNEMVQIFTELGFTVATGPELETEWYNFDALNVPATHPARDMQDTFWIADQPGRVLRTHTTSATVRYLEQAVVDGMFPEVPNSGSIAAYISTGKVFRNEATDMTHEMQFYQIDGAVVGTDISMAHLKGVLTEFYKKLLGDDVQIRFRPSYFPFVEPGVEIDVLWNGKWMELMGAGMLHPNVLRNVGIDPDVYQGFAFGGGVDRVVMVKYGIPDVRLLYQGDLRLNQW